MTILMFTLSGEAAAAAGAEFKDTLGDIVPGVDVVMQAPEALPEAARKAIDPIALAALIVSVPSAILAVVDLADRIEKRRRAQKLIDAAKRLRTENSVTVLVLDAATPKPLADLTPDDMLDIARSAD
jgi:hypothetical protein